MNKKTLEEKVKAFCLEYWGEGDSRSYEDDHIDMLTKFHTQMLAKFIEGVEWPDEKYLSGISDSTHPEKKFGNKVLNPKFLEGLRLGTVHGVSLGGNLIITEIKSRLTKTLEEIKA